MDWDSLRLSLQTGLASTALAFVIGIPVAWGLSRLRGWTHDLLSSAVLVPMVLPPTVLGYYLLLAVGRNSPIGGALDAVVVNHAHKPNTDNSDFYDFFFAPIS